MMYAFGILTGLVVAILNILALLYFKGPVERSVNQLYSSLKEKGKILEPQNEELNAWVDTLKHENTSNQ